MKLKGKKIVWLLGIIGLAGLASNVQAIPTLQVGDWITLSDGPGSSPGGSFVVRPVSSPADSYLTFCVERDEYFYPGQSLQIIAISGAAYGGGVNTDTGDKLDPMTAYLYHQFLFDPTSIGFDKTSEAHYTALQQVIWGIEEELGSMWAPAPGLQTAFYDYARNSGWINIGDIRVLTLVAYDSSGNQIARQDQLYSVPEPLTVLILGASILGGWAALRWRRQT